MKAKIFTAAAAIVLGTACTLAQQTQSFTGSKANEYGLVYALPLTVLDITVETQHVERMPGEFVNYAKRHLALDNAIRVPDASVTVKSVTVTPRGVPDPDNRWLVQFKAGSNISMSLTRDEMPLSINTAPVSPEAVQLPEAVEAAPTPLETEAARQAVTADMTRSTSLAKKAELAAARIFELREQRNELISGNSDNMPADAGALTVALKNLDAQEAALTAMFGGTEKVYTRVSTFTVKPGAHPVTDTLVARVSPLEGVVASTDLSGEPLLLSVDVVSQGKLPLTEKGEPKRFPKGGVAYNIPGTARIKLTMAGRTLATAEVSLAQLGCTFGLDPGLFTDKKAPMSAVFSPVTGAVIRLDNAPVQ